MAPRKPKKRRTVPGLDTIAGRLRWTIVTRLKPEGRRRGLRLFQEKMAARARQLDWNQKAGVTLSSLQNYLSGITEPSPSFLEEAAKILGVRAAWLTHGDGAPTEEQQAARWDGSEGELLRISNIVYEELGVPTRVPPGAEVLKRKNSVAKEGDRFWGSATWAPLVRQTMLRLYGYRPSWKLLSGGNAPLDPAKSQEASDQEWDRALADTAGALAAPLMSIGIEGSGLSLNAVADYVSSVCLALQRLMWEYVPGGSDATRPASTAPLRPYVVPHPSLDEEEE